MVVSCQYLSITTAGGLYDIVLLLKAMPAYHRSLELKPRYARGLLNLGISHSNVGSFEAVR